MPDTPRTLRSKRKRAALWLAAEGKCQICGQDLEEKWHADHIVPYSVTGRTNVHEMQALCPECNLRKGDKLAVDNLRKHQREILQACEDILAGATFRDIIAFVTPGGGKSFLPAIIADKLIPTFADKICWVVPRQSLQDQGEQDFNIAIRKDIFYFHPHEVRLSTNDIDPSRGMAGFITTYQAIQHDAAGLLADEFRRHEYILVLDEFYHNEENGVWHTKLKPLYELACVRFFMGGTMERGDGKKIGFVPYKQRGNELLPYSRPEDSDEKVKVIRYTRRDALEEKAIIPLLFYQHNAHAEWFGLNGEMYIEESLAEAGKNARPALFTALRTEYALELLKICWDDWLTYRQVYEWAKMLVIAPNKEEARKFLRELRKWAREWNQSSPLKVHVELAISKDTSEQGIEDPEARRVIGEFREESTIHVLVTVAICYEGLNKKEITHIACLTGIRSKPWLEQAFSRANRPFPGKEFGLIYAPDDPMMIEVMETIKADQPPAIFVPEDQERGERGGGGEPGYIEPITSFGTDLIARTLAGQEISSAELQILEQIMKDKVLPGTNPFTLIQIIHEYNLRMAQQKGIPQRAATLDTSFSFMRPSERERKIRQAIDLHIGRYAQWILGDAALKKYINKWLISDIFKKSRTEMTLPELGKVLAFLKRHLQLDSEKAYGPLRAFLEQQNVDWKDGHER